jgi:hypothetical protein
LARQGNDREQNLAGMLAIIAEFRDLLEDDLTRGTASGARV